MLAVRHTGGVSLVCPTGPSAGAGEEYIAQRQGRKQLYQTKQTLQGSRDTCAGDIPKL